MLQFCKGNSFQLAIFSWITAFTNEPMTNEQKIKQ